MTVQHGLEMGMTTEIAEPVGLNIRLNPGAQEGFVKCLEPFPAMKGGSGSGKTRAGVIKVGLYSIQKPGARGVITEPIYSHFQDVLLPAFREQWGGDLEGTLWHEQGRGGPNHQIMFANGSLILLKAAEAAERLVGFEAAWVWMDEACSSEGGSQEQAYFHLVGRLRQKGYRHWLGLTSTPSGFDWSWREWEESPDQARKTGHVLFRGSSYDNREHLPEGYIKRMEQIYGVGTPMYRQYLLGESVQMEGLVVPTFNPNTMIAPWPRNEVFLRNLAGVDFAPQSPTAIVEVGLTQSGRKWLREWLYKRECDDETFVKGCRNAMDAGVTLFIGDPSGRERIEWMNKQGIPTIRAPSNDIDRRVKAWLTPVGEDRLTITSNSQFLIREVMGLSWARARGRELDTNRFNPLMPDHAWDAGAYGLMGIERMIPRGTRAPNLKVNL